MNSLKGTVFRFDAVRFRKAPGLRTYQFSLLPLREFLTFNMNGLS